MKNNKNKQMKETYSLITSDVISNSLKQAGDIFICCSGFKSIRERSCMGKGEDLQKQKAFVDCREMFSIFICRTYLNGTTLKWFYLWFTDWVLLICGRHDEADLGRSHQTLQTAQLCNMCDMAMESIFRFLHST